LRPTEVETLLGGSHKAMIMLGCAPKISFDGLERELVAEYLKFTKRDELVKKVD
jgi:GDP-D-mannose dehydratase